MKHQTNQTKPQPVSDQPEENLEYNKLEQEIEEWKSKYIRALADYQNLEKRTTVDKEETRKFAAEITLRKFLPAVDSLERAVKHISDEGLALSLKEFHAALTSCGVKKMEVVGEPFDPFTMECIEVVEGEEGIVLEETTSGYTFYDKVLRVAQVKVGKK